MTPYSVYLLSDENVPKFLNYCTQCIPSMDLQYGDDPLLARVVGYGILAVLGSVVSLPIQAVRLYLEVSEEIGVILVYESLEILIL